MTMSRRKAPKDGEVKGIGMRAQHDSQCARFIQISWRYDGKDRMAGLVILLSKKRLKLKQHHEVLLPLGDACGEMESAWAT